MALTRKRLLLIGFILVLLIGIPATLFVVQQQQEIRSRAEKSTTLYYQPESSQALPIQKTVGDSFSLDVYVNPGTNLVSGVRLEIEYDPAKLATASATGSEPAFVPDPQALPNILFGPVYTPGRIAVVVTSGGDPTQVVDTITKIGTITFNALASTQGSVTQVAYGPDTLVTSAAGVSAQNAEGDQPAEDVLSATTPAFIVIADGVPTVTNAPTATPTLIALATATPTEVPDVTDTPDEPTPIFTEAPTATPTATPEPVDSTDTTNTNTENPPTATPTLAPSGPGDVMLGFGVALAILTILGGILFFAL